MKTEVVESLSMSQWPILMYYSTGIPGQESRYSNAICLLLMLTNAYYSCCKKPHW